MHLAVVTLAILASAHSFTIPLLFGGISLDRTNEGHIAVGIQRGVNVLGNGFQRNTNFVVGNATFGINDAADVLVNGRRSGPRSSLGVGKDGFKIGGGVESSWKRKQKRL
ncbi:hypothetical protein RB195_018423 [Necator americanus]|uniref:Uncharacterized protein n=1 Tax=Necator americanus TaxID=51031 RepID=A0ABR1CAV9_NECAM